MAQSLTHKIIREHLIEGEMIPGREIGIKMDQTLTQDSTGTMVYLEFNAMGIPAVKTELSVSYIDHNTLQTGFDGLVLPLSPCTAFGLSIYLFTVFFDMPSSIPMAYALFPFCAFSRIMLISPLLIIRSSPIKVLVTLLW
jgi:hypothetical protein